MLSLKKLKSSKEFLKNNKRELNKKLRQLLDLNNLDSRRLPKREDRKSLL